MRPRHLRCAGNGGPQWHVRCALATSLASGLMLLSLAGAQGPGTPFRNLRVLPDDIGRDELIETMKVMTKSLGTDCRYCHRTDIPDYASDGVKAKVVAREMMRLVERLNRASPGSAVTCFTCHRGHTKPPQRQ